MAWLLTIILVLLVLAYSRGARIGALAVVIAVTLFFFNELDKTNVRIDKERHVYIVAEIDSKFCQDKNYPLKLKFENQSGDTITYISFAVSAFRKNFSKPVLSGSYETDRIIPNGGEWSACWKVPDGYSYGNQPEDLIWKAAVSNVNWR